EQDIALKTLKMAGGKPLRARRLLESDLLEKLESFTEVLEKLESGSKTPLQCAKMLDMLPDIEMLEAFQYRLYSIIRSEVPRQNRQVSIYFRFLDKLGKVKMRLLSPSNPNNQ